MENRKHIGELYRKRRIEKGMTQGELAALSKVSLRSIQRIENGSVSARSYTLGVLAAQLDFEVPGGIEIPLQDRAATSNRTRPGGYCCWWECRPCLPWAGVPSWHSPRDFRKLPLNCCSIGLHLQRYAWLYC